MADVFAAVRLPSNLPAFVPPPQVALVLVVLLALYVVGTARIVRPSKKEYLDRRAWLAHTQFVSSLALTWTVLCGAVDHAADARFSAHMVQHMILTSAVAPLLVGSRPWTTLKAGLPLRARRIISMITGPAKVSAALRAVCGSPGFAFASFVAALWVWHLPALYNLALRNDTIHATEHLRLLVGGVLLWSHALGIPLAGDPFSPVKRATYLVAAMAQGTLLAFVIAFALPPYGPYLSSSGSFVAAIADQRLGAALMVAVGGLPMIAAIAWCLGQWVIAMPPDEAPPHTESTLLVAAVGSMTQQSGADSGA